MNAHTRNIAERLLFSNGGQLDIVCCPNTETETQAEARTEREKEEAHKIMMRGLKEFGMIKECPWVSGADKDDEIPF